MADATDPLSLVYNALWDLLEAHTGLTGLVAVGNRVKYDAFGMVSSKDVLQDADVPEVAIIPIGLTYGLQISSSSTEFVQRYAAELVTGTSQLAQTGGFLPVKWEVIRALADWQSVLTALTWESQNFVKTLRGGDLTDSLLRDGGPGARKITGWRSLMMFEVTMYLTTASIQP